jgi:hypothetical protein
MEQRRYNPYVFGPPVDDPAFFFGRAYELGVIMNTIANLAPGLRQSMAIVGPRRIGKSSLLLQLIRRLEPHPNATALVSTEQFDPPSRLALAREILRALREGAQSKRLEAASVPFDLLDGPAPSDDEVFLIFRRDLKRLNDALAAGKQLPAVLMIDEVEGLVEFGGLRVLGVFRDLAQSLPYVLFVVAGSDRLYQLINDNTSPFFNVFKTITIAPLREEDARAMIREPAERANITFDVAVIDEIVRLSGGLPLLINMICHYATAIMLAQDRPAVTQRQVEAACRHILTNEQGYFLDMWGRIQGLEKVVLYVIARADKPRSLSDVASDVAEIIDFSQPIVQVHDLLRQLVRRQILRQDEAKCYRFTNQLVPIWLRQNRTAPQVAEESLPPTVPSITSDPESERVFLEQLLSIHTDNLAFLEEQARAARPSGRLKQTILLIKQRIERTEQRLVDLRQAQASHDHEVPEMLISTTLSDANHQDLIEEIERFEEIYSVLVKRLHRLEEQNALLGIHTPPYVAAELEEIRERIQQTNSRLISLREQLNPSPQLQASSLTSEERERLQDLIRVYRKRLSALERRRAVQGINTDPSIVIELEDIRAKLEELQRALV